MIRKTILFYLFLLILSSSTVFAETVSPLTSVSITPTSPNGNNGWYKTPVEVIFSATDLGSGVKTIDWRIDSSGWNTSLFENTLNLASNPSFENSSNPPISGWVFSGQPGNLGVKDNTVSKFDASSAKIISSQNGWSGFTNCSNYIPATPFSNMTTSTWIKNSGVAGVGTYFKIYALHPSGSSLIAQSSPILGTQDWLRIEKNFYVSVNDAYGVCIDLGVDGIGTVYYDGVSVNKSLIDTSTAQTFSQNGNHTIDYYSIDNDNNQENPNNTIPLKIDTVSPTNWRDFSAEQSGNDHTLKSEIKVDDPSSGIDSLSGYFQYSIDGGTNWGYYSNLTSCGSTWIADGWRALSTDLENDGKTAELKTPAVDYCNSNWAICKIVRFKVADLSGNDATKDVCINGAWFRATGDVGSRAAVTLSSAGASDNSDGVIFSASTIGNFTSSSGWYVTNYLLPQKMSYDEWFSTYPTDTLLPSGKLPKTSGIFINNGSFTISSSTLPSSFSSAIFSAIVYINGDLTINTDFSIRDSSALVFIVNGDARVDKNVKNISGFFIVNGQIDTSYNGNSGSALTVKGSLAADTLIIARSLKGKENSNDPAVDIIYQPIYLTSLNSILGSEMISWQEITP